MLVADNVRLASIVLGLMGFLATCAIAILTANTSDITKLMPILERCEALTLNQEQEAQKAVYMATNIIR
jgi:hypothetical protein